MSCPCANPYKQIGYERILDMNECNKVGWSFWGEAQLEGLRWKFGQEKGSFGARSSGCAVRCAPRAHGPSSSPSGPPPKSRPPQDNQFRMCSDAKQQKWTMFTGLAGGSGGLIVVSALMLWFG
jgi:hypothetical protein